MKKVLIASAVAASLLIASTAFAGFFAPVCPDGKVAVLINNHFICPALTPVN